MTKREKACTSKNAAYVHKREAEAFAKQHDMFVYFCKFCGLYHLTKQMTDSKFNWITRRA